MRRSPPDYPPKGSHAADERLCDNCGEPANTHHQIHKTGAHSGKSYSVYIAICPTAVLSIDPLKKAKTSND